MHTLSLFKKSRRGLTVALTVSAMALMMLAANTAQAFNGPFCGTSSSPVHLQGGAACIHGAAHSSYQWLYGQSTGTAYTRAGVSSSSSSEVAIVSSTSGCGGCLAGFTGGGGSTWPGGYAFLHDHSTFASDFYGSIGG